MFTFKRGKSPSFSSVENEPFEFSPSHPEELIFGGALLSAVEKIAAKVAFRHCQKEVKSFEIDSIRFFSPVKKGDILSVSASINRAWDSYLEVGVKVVAEDLLTLDKRKVLSAYFLFKAEDLEPIVPETKEQKRRFFCAQKRRFLNKFI